MLVSYNVLCVIYGDYRRFMKRVIHNPKILGFLLVMLVLHFLPLIFLLIQNFDNYFYSYAPTGIPYYDTSGREVELLLYCGINFNRESWLWQALAI